MAFEPPHDVGAVRFDGLEGGSQRGGDLAAIFALRQKLHDFTLPRRQPKSVILPIIFWRLLAFVQENLRHVGSEEGLIPLHSFNGVDQLAGGVGILESAAVLSSSFETAVG